MKISKVSWLLIIAGVIIIAFVSLGMARSQQLANQASLSDELDALQEKLAEVESRGLSAQEVETQQKLTETEAMLKTTIEFLSPELESIAISDQIGVLAGKSKVTIVSIASGEKTATKLNGLTCEAIILNINAQGSPGALINYIQSLNDYFTTGTADNVTVNVREETLPGEGTTASIRFILYSVKSEGVN